MRHTLEKKLSLISILLFISFTLLMVITLEYIGSHFLGLGKVVEYDVSALYGYRLKPDQDISRKKNINIKVNNLSLRADNNWNINATKNKVLFLGDSVTYGGSYIDNSELFSTLTVKNFKGYEAGNAGVNGWGVLNIYALVHDYQFLPANTVITTLPEGDFLRGMMRIGGQPFWTHKPKYGLEEIIQYGIYKLNLKRISQIYLEPTGFEREQILKIAVQKLKKLDTHIKQSNAKHLIYITPSRDQALKKSNTDEQLKTLLNQYDVKVNYILDKLPKNLNNSQVQNLFHDTIHLTKAGHQVWAEVMAKDLEKYLL